MQKNITQNITNSIQIVPNKLTWIIAPKAPQEKHSIVCFNTQRLNHRIPTGISVEDLKQFLNFINDLFQRNTHIVYYTKNDQDNLLIGSMIVCFFKMVVLGQSAQNAYKLINDLGIPLKQFGEHSQIPYNLQTVLNIIDNIKTKGFFDSKCLLESQISTQQGNVYRVLAGKLFVFEFDRIDTNLPQNQRLKRINKFYKTLKQLNITNIIGFEGDYHFPYDHNEFSLNGLMHNMISVYVPLDPDIEIVTKGLSLMKSQGIYAINSQDEFGISMTFVAAFAIKILKYTLQEAVCWCRMMIPNCIRQEQLQWLKKKYKSLIGKDTYVTAQQAFKHIKKNGIIYNTDVYN